MRTFFRTISILVAVALIYSVVWAIAWGVENHGYKTIDSRDYEYRTATLEVTPPESVNEKFLEIDGETWLVVKAEPLDAGQAGTDNRALDHVPQGMRYHLRRERQPGLFELPRMPAWLALGVIALTFLWLVSYIRKYRNDKFGLP